MQPALRKGEERTRDDPMDCGTSTSALAATARISLRLFLCKLQKRTEKDAEEPPFGRGESAVTGSVSSASFPLQQIQKNTGVHQTVL